MIASDYEKHIATLRKPVGNSYLTQREHAVMQHLIAGERPKVIAGKLGNTESTVHGLIHHAKQRLKARTIFHLIAICVRAQVEQEVNNRQQ